MSEQKIERRTFGELRAGAGDDPALIGCAASYNVLSQDLGGFREMIAPGAFNDSLAQGDDVACLFNHDSSRVLGRRSAGTLKVWSDARGLQYRCELDPENSDHMNLRRSVLRGDVHECSFAFTVPDGGDSFDDATDDDGQRFVRRTLRSVKLIDVSAVTYPAYNSPGATVVGARSANGSWAADRLKRLGEIMADANHRERAHEIGMQLLKEGK